MTLKISDLNLQNCVSYLGKKYNDDKDEILLRAQITKAGQLTPRFSYLQDYVNT